MNLVVAGIVVISAASAGSSQSTFQFDLNCTGTITIRNIGSNDFEPATPVDAGPSPYTTRFRVDLESKTFCQDTCDSRETIAAIQPTAILLRSSNQPFFESHFSLDRTDGSFAFDWKEAGSRDERKPYVAKSARGTCQKEPFTRLPENAF